jgi:hypothetical protein
MTEIAFVGGVGGILGLFLGFSFLSAAEIVYFAAGRWLPGRTRPARNRKRDLKRRQAFRQRSVALKVNNYI